MRRRLVAAAALALVPALVAPAADALPPPGGEDDLTPPVISIKAPSGAWSGWYPGPVTLEASAVDADDKVDTMSWKLTGAQTGSGSKLGGNTTYVQVSTPGVSTLTVTASDPSGNTSEKIWVLGVDLEEPTITTDLPQGAELAFGSTRVLNFSCTDDWTGVSFCGSTVPNGTPLPTDTLGAKSVSLVAQDNVAHRREVILDYEVVPATFTLVEGIQVNGVGRVGSTVRVPAPAEWTPAPESLEYQWLRDGDPIPGATAPQYTITAADLGKSLRARETVHRANYVTAETTTPSLVVEPGQFSVTQEATVDGTPTVGRQLVATPPVLQPVAEEVELRWLRDGVLVAIGNTYTVAAADAGHRIALEYAARRSGYANRVGRIDLGEVPRPQTARVTSRTTAAVRAPRKRKVATITVRVAAAGLTPTGVVSVLRNGRVIRTGTLRAGTVTVTVPRKKRVRQVLVVRYAGTPKVLPSQTTVRIPRR